MNGWSKNGHEHATSAIPAVSTPAAERPLIALLHDFAPSWPPAEDGWPAAQPDEFDRERSRLEAEIAVAKARTAVARHRVAQREAEVHAALRAEILDSQEQLAEMERDHESAVTAVREAARVEAARIIATAREQLAGRAGGVVIAEPAQVPSVE